MKIDILTLFPNFFTSIFSESIIGNAVKKGLVNINCTNIRDFSQDKHNRVDDYPYGGGPGMIMKAGPIYRAINKVKSEKAKIIYMSPKGKIFNQQIAKKLSKESHLVLLCGHYEGIDNRIVENYINEEISIGDYVLTGGEIGAMVIVDAVVRLIPGVLSSSESYEDESHYNGLLEYPQYTRPREFNNLFVPNVLLSGNHKEIEKWRKYQSLKITYKNRKDLLQNKEFTKEEQEMLNEIISSEKNSN